MKKLTTTLSFMALFLTATTVNAALIKTADLKKYCTYETSPRQTVIYLDQTIIGSKDRDWFKDLINKIDYLPSERLTIAKINEQSRVEDLYTGCYPKVSAKTMKHLMDKKGLFDADPKAVLKDDQKAFRSAMLRAFSDPVKNAKTAQVPSYSVKELPPKALVEALYYDASRTELVNGVPRIFIFSDMAEQSKHYRGQGDAVVAAKKASKRFPVSFNNATIYAYGVSSTFDNSDYTENYLKFWKQFFNASHANLVSFQQQLPSKERAIPFTPISYKGVMKFNGRDIATNIRLEIPVGMTSGNLNNAYFAIKDKMFPLKGHFECSGLKCNIQTTITYPDSSTTFKKGDVVNLEGSIMGKMTGTVGSIDESTTTETGGKFEYSLVFKASKQLTF